MKREANELQNKIDKILETLCDTIDIFEKKKSVLVKQYTRLNEIKYEKEKVMRYYELVFIGFDGDSYNQEMSWTIETNKTYDEMQDYVHDLNIKFKEEIDEHPFFYVNETWVYKQLPTYDELLDDLKEL